MSAPKLADLMKLVACLQIVVVVVIVVLLDHAFPRFSTVCCGKLVLENFCRQTHVDGEEWKIRWCELKAGKAIGALLAGK